MTDELEEMARKIFDEINGPYITLTPLGQEKVDIIRGHLRTLRSKTRKEDASIANNCTIDWGILQHDDRCREQIVQAILKKDEDETRV